MGNAYTFDLKIIRYWDRKDYPEKVGNRLTGGYGKKDPPPLGLIGLTVYIEYFKKTLSLIFLWFCKVFKKFIVKKTSF